MMAHISFTCPSDLFEIDEFLRDVKQVYDRLGRCIVAVSEGIHDGSGQPIIARLAKEVERDAHGNVQLSGSGALADLLTQKVKEELQITRVRGDTLGYIQRSFVGCVSDVDQNEAREVGEKAVQYGMFGDRDGSVTIKRTGHYSVDYELVSAGTGCRKDPDNARHVHLGFRSRRDRRVPSISAALAGQWNARRLSPTAEQGAEDPGGKVMRTCT
jgi:6-phosphofructokinase